MEHAAEMWWAGECTVCRKLKSAQIRVSRRLLGAGNKVTGVTVQGDQGWRRGVKR